LQFALRAGKRVIDAFVGPQADDVAALHPPTAVMTLSLTSVTIPGVDEPINFLAPKAIECEATPAFGKDFTQPQCSNLNGTAFVPTDGLLPSEGTVPFNPDSFGSLTVRY
jgi:hypothetical protein